jgi:ABC-type transport system substrate-binding protein
MQNRQMQTKRLLAEASYAMGLEVHLMLRRGPLYEHGALSPRDDLKKVGINLESDLVDTATHLDRQEEGDFAVYSAPASVQMGDPDLYYARFTCEAVSNYGRLCNSEFDKLFAEQSRTFDDEKRAEITRKMERILLEEIPDDRCYYWKSTMGYWNQVQNWPPLLGTTVYNYGEFEQVWCQGGQCM